jgi:hypothetical protein
VRALRPKKTATVILSAAKDPAQGRRAQMEFALIAPGDHRAMRKLRPRIVRCGGIVSPLNCTPSIR